MNDMLEIASKKLRGVYTIERLDTGREYIGGTTTSFAERWHQHRALLECGNHPCRALQADWTSRNADFFEFRIVEIVEDPQRVWERERYWLGLNAHYCKPNEVYNSFAVTEIKNEARFVKLRKYAHMGWPLQRAYKEVGGNFNVMAREWRNIKMAIKSGSQ